MLSTPTQTTVSSYMRIVSYSNSYRKMTRLRKIAIFNPKHTCSPHLIYTVMCNAMLLEIAFSHPEHKFSSHLMQIGLKPLP